MLKLEEINNYENAVSYIMMIPRFSGKNSIEETRLFYEFMKEPGSRASIIHVAGTNGKGSVCAFLNSILGTMGKRVGLFTSPHLVSIEERICVNNQMIEKQEFYDVFCVLRKELFDFRNSDGSVMSYHPSFFEFIFFMAMLYFERQKVDSIILETGLGGRLDATNVIRKAVACIITEIGYDHMEYLGDTLEQIAFEKAGIILEDTPVIFWDKQEETTNIIQKYAIQKNAPCIKVSNENGNLNGIHDKDIDFSYKSRYYEYVRLTCHTKALYQMDNALVALTAVEYTYGKEELSEAILKKGISDMSWSGRMEEVLPNVFLDGAHNEDGLTAFLETVKRTSGKGRNYLIFSAVSDKQVGKMIHMIMHSNLFEKVIAVRIDNSRALKREQLTDLFREYTDAEILDLPEAAFEQLLHIKKENDCIYVAGSLYLVGQIKQWVSANMRYPDSSSLEVI